MVKSKLKWHQKGLLISMLITVVFFPVTGMYINMGVDWLFTQIFMYGSPVLMVTGAYIGIYLLYSVKPEPINIPNKNSKTPKSKFIET